MEPALVLGVALPPLGITLLRAGRGRAAHARTAAGWALIALGFAVLARHAGAWGMALGALAAIGTAGMVLAYAAWTTPAGHAAAAREPATTISWRFQRSGTGRRVAVFAMVVPVAFAAAQLLAFGAQSAARRAGWAEADATVLALLLQPTAWAILMSVQMTRPGPAQMLPLALVCAGLGMLLWWPR